MKRNVFETEPEKEELRAVKGWHAIIDYRDVEFVREIYCPTEHEQRKEEVLAIRRQLAALTYLRNHSRGWKRHIYESQMNAQMEQQMRYIAREELMGIAHENMRALQQAAMHAAAEVMGADDTGH